MPNQRFQGQHLLAVLIWLPLAIFLIFNLAVQQHYVERSRALPGVRSASFIEIPNASRSGLLNTLADLRKEVGASAVVISDSPNVSLQKLESAYFVGHPMIFLAGDNFSKLSDVADLADPPQLRRQALYQESLRLSIARESTHKRERFMFPSPRARPKKDEFYLDSHYKHIKRPQTFLLTTGSSQSIFNRWKGEAEGAEIDLVPWGSISDHLLFVTSTLGLYNEHNPHTSLSSLEPDFYGSATMAGLGRYLLLQVLNPSRDSRLLMSVTSSLRKDGRNELPPVKVYGAKSSQMPFVGRGSARVLGPAVKPRWIDGEWFYLIDMGINGKVFSWRRQGFLNLYGTSVNVDSRRLTVFGRDISLLTQRVLDETEPPPAVSTFPKDLENKSLLYSGIYEDGWFSDVAMLRLKPQAKGDALRIEGSVPALSGSGHICRAQVSVDGHVVARQDIADGDYFRISAELGKAFSRRPHEVLLRFSQLQALPGEYGRPVSAFIKYAGFSKW